MKTIKLLSISLCVLLFVSCGDVLKRNKDVIVQALNANSNRKGREVKSYSVAKLEIKDRFVDVFVEGLDERGNLFKDTLPMTDDGFGNWKVR